MKALLTCLALTLVLSLASAGEAALVKIPFSDILLGTETTTLIPNGGFEANGGNNGPSADGWIRQGVPQSEMYVTSDNVGGLIPDYDDGDFVAKAHVTPLSDFGLYQRSVLLDANTDYVLSAYMWNLSDPNDVTRQWNINVDLTDAPTDPQLRLLPTDADADSGYFVYNTFNTGDTGFNVQVRVFYDSPGGATTGWPQQPVGALWDRIAITRASDFVAPVPEPASLFLFAIALGFAGRQCRRLSPKS